MKSTCVRKSELLSVIISCFMILIALGANKIVVGAVESNWGYTESGGHPYYAAGLMYQTGFVLKKTNAGACYFYWENGTAGGLRVQIFKNTTNSSSGGTNVTCDGSGVIVSYCNVFSIGSYGIYNAVPANYYCYLRVGVTSSGTAWGIWDPL